MNYYEHHIGDFDSATAHLSLVEDAVYRRLICLYYRSEAPIPADVKQACRLVRAVSKAERDTVADVLREFFSLEADGWHNTRCDEEIARFQDKQRKARASADARWSKAGAHTERNANASPDAMRTHSEGNAPRARPQTPDSRPNTSEPDGSGATAPPPTDRDVVFAAGVAMLTAANITDKNARSFLAMQCKAHGEATVRAALDRCAEERPIEPITWLQAALKGKPSGPVKSRFIADREAQASRWIGTATLPGIGGEVIDAEEARHGTAPAIR